MVRDRTVLLWEVAGGVVVYLLGIFVHVGTLFVGSPPATAGFLTVNESVWEHLKMGYWPVFVVAAVQYRWLAADARNFLAAKALAALVVPAVSALVLYGRGVFLGAEVLLLDLGSFFVGTVAGQFASYRLLTGAEQSRGTRRALVGAAVALGFAFWAFTFAPPPLEPFEDPLANGTDLMGPVNATGT